MRVAAGAAVVLVVLASGSTTPLWSVLQPIFKYVRYPSKLVPYAVLLGVALGALGLARAVERRSWRVPAALARTVAELAGLRGVR